MAKLASVDIKSNLEVAKVILAHAVSSLEVTSYLGDSLNNLEQTKVASADVINNLEMTKVALADLIDNLEVTETVLDDAINRQEATSCLSWQHKSDGNCLCCHQKQLRSKS